MAELFEPTLTDQIAEVEREITMRQRVYPRLVQNRTLSQAKADRSIETMRAVLATLTRLRDLMDDAAAL